MRKIIQFLKEVREEFKQITWPKREALIQLTIVVISISIIISLILGGFDYLFINTMAALGKPKAPVNTSVPSASPSLEPLPSSSTLPTIGPTVKPTLAPKK